MIKLLSKAKPNRENFAEFTRTMNYCKTFLSRHTEGEENYFEMSELMKELIARQDTDGSWRLIFSEGMPYDAKVYYWKYPTIMFTALMIKFLQDCPKECDALTGFHETLIQALDIVQFGRLTGHGFDSFKFRIEALEILLHAGVMQFIQQYPSMNKAFNRMIYQNKTNIEEILRKENGKTYCSVELDKLRKLLNRMGYETINLFVYGTLMHSNTKGITYLEGAEYKGEYVLDGYALYDLGYYPGIIEDTNEKVKGEIYVVSKEMLPLIDVYEAEGSLYRRIKVLVYDSNNNDEEAFVYVYNHSVSGKQKINFSLQPWFEGIVDSLKNYVWYACYGSNINRERFMKYILGDRTGALSNSNGCSDKTPPRGEQQIILNHPIYFAKYSPKWSNRGVAFLDAKREGLSYCKMYLITKEQFGQIQQMEGAWYNERIELGYEKGIPIMTITHSSRYAGNTVPVCAYIDTIAEGLCATYSDMSDTDALAYLYRRFLNCEHKRMLSYLRGQAHGVSIRRLEEGLSSSFKNTRCLIDDLKAAGIIKQDGRSIRSGIAWDAPDAVYYTVPEKRMAIDKVVRS